MKYIFLLLSASFLAACQPAKDLTDPQIIIDESIAHHGFGDFGNSGFSLRFRDKDYTYRNENGKYQYTRQQTDSAGAKIYDVLDNDGLVRYIDEQETEINDERRGAYARSVNSVIYFFRLPYGLNDDAVVKTFKGERQIKDKTYLEVQITFRQQGGGDHYEDLFLYWFDKEDFSMDYMAYLYFTDGGGIRFREAINQREVNGHLIQDYINFKPKDEQVDIHSVLDLYKRDELIELSKIINENVIIE